MIWMCVERRSVTTRYHGSKICGSQEHFSWQRRLFAWKKTMGYLCVPECNRAQDVNLFSLFSAILMRSRNFATVTTSSLYKLTRVAGSHTSISHSLPCGTYGRAHGRMVTWLPEFLGCTDNQILLLMVLRERALLKTVHRPWTILIILLTTKATSIKVKRLEVTSNFRLSHPRFCDAEGLGTKCLWFAGK